MEELQKKAKIIRKHIVEMLHKAGSGHPGGSLSAVEIVTYLYFKKMKYDAKDPSMPNRDRFVLSKGHACPVVYAALAEAGFFSYKELLKLRKIDCTLQGHPDMKCTPGVEMSTGALGQGLSVANGMAIAGKLDKKDFTVYCMMGDGEIQEGQIWEAAMTAAHYKLDNLVGIIDNNGLQIDGKTCDVMDLQCLKSKWKAFGWHVIEIDGHDFTEIDTAFTEAETIKGKPVMIIANTIKGKGVSFMENQSGWHGKAPCDEECQKSLREIGE